MVTAELVKVVDLRARCFFCNKRVGEEEFCEGCGNFICSACDWTSPNGDHNVGKHQEVDEDD